MFGVQGQKLSGGRLNATLLVLIDRVACVDPASGPAISNLNKYEACAVEHDEINLSVAAADIACNMLESTALKIARNPALDTKP
jgi:hypothetical protein